jgi:hypothetical protein
LPQGEVWDRYLYANGGQADDGSSNQAEIDQQPE